jgi:thiosulfate dehydrogenase (quinone) large subunit
MFWKKDNILKTKLSLLFSDKPLLSPTNRLRFLVMAQGIYGLLWIEGASWKVLVDGKLAFNYEGLTFWVSRGSEYPVLGAYKWLLDTLILPNIKLLLPIVFLIEFTIGILFLIGKYVRLAALMAIAQTIFITLSVLNAPHEWKWSYFLMLLVAVIFFVLPTTSKWPNKLVQRK